MCCPIDQSTDRCSSALDVHTVCVLTSHHCETGLSESYRNGLDVRRKTSARLPSPALLCAEQWSAIYQEQLQQQHQQKQQALEALVGVFPILWRAWRTLAAASRWTWICLIRISTLSEPMHCEEEKTWRPQWEVIFHCSFFFFYCKIISALSLEHYAHKHHKRLKSERPDYFLNLVDEAMKHELHPLNCSAYICWIKQQHRGETCLAECTTATSSWCVGSTVRWNLDTRH